MPSCVNLATVTTRNALTGKPDAVRAVVYCRISKDEDLTGLGVARQERDCRKRAEERGWSVSEVFVDNDASAFQARSRPRYEAMMKAVDGGKVDVILAWHPDRLYRRFDDLVAFTSAIERSGVRVETVMSGEVDLATAAGRMNARMLGTVAAYESEHKSERIKAKMDELAAAGKSGGAARTFGYDRPRLPDGTPVPGTRPEILHEEAERIREAVRRVLAGESLYAVVQDWSTAGVPTVRGARWSTTALKTILTSPRIAGLRVHRGEVVGPAEWDPIIDRPTWERVGAVLDQRSKARTRIKRRYLLSGLVDCGTCGHPLVATPRGRKVAAGRRGRYRVEKGATQRAYGCVKANGGCGSIFILAEPLEDWVEERIQVALGGPGLARAVRQLSQGSTVDETSKLMDDLSAAEQRLADLGVAYAEGDIDMRAFRAAQAGLRTLIDETKEALAADNSGASLDGLGDISAEWSGMTMDRQRAVIETVMRPSVAAASGARNRFDPLRIDPHWKI